MKSWNRRSLILMMAAAVVVPLVMALVAGTGSEAPARTDLEEWQEVSDIISREAFFEASPVHRQMLLNLVRKGPSAEPQLACCWTDMTSWALMDAFNQAIYGAQPEFILGSRWVNVATPGGGTGQGDPTTLRYSFVPDGTSVPSGTGEPAGVSNLFSSFTAVFGSQATWQNLMHQTFQRWGELTGITYVHEPMDDGATLFGSPGVIGVRGDIRVSGKSIDGSGGSNVLAYNFFPSGGGDMVLDTDNASWFSNTTNNYRRLRNTMAHEHGHGLGLFHVCPVSNEKLMEPTITTAFDGPQLDDIRGGQRQYGDTYENNNTSAQATDLGILNNGTHSVIDASIDDNSDVDWIKFTVTGNKQLGVTVTPVGTTYTAGPQTSTCNSGASIAAAAIHDLGFEIRDTNGTTVLATINQTGLAQSEVISGITLPSGPGTYFVRVFGSLTNDVQRYTAQLTISDTVPPAFTITYPNGVPSTTPPNLPVDVDILTTPGTTSPDPTTAQLFARLTGGTFASSPLQILGGGLLRATLPGAGCLTDIEWYVSIAPVGGGAPVISPQGAPTQQINTTEAITLPLMPVFSDNFQTNTGWVVTNSAALTDGPWGRGVPAGGGARGDPPTDSDGSGMCYLTDNVAGNSDVDGGATYLTSPSFDLSGVTGARIEVDIWYDNDFGSNPGTDPFLIQISSNNGSSWTPLESYNVSPDAWVTRSYRLSDYPISLTSNMKMRFIAQDPPPGAVVEAGVDAFKVLTCGSSASLDPICGAGTVGITTPTGVENVFQINLQTGGPARRVDLSVGSSMLLQMLQPSLTSTPGQAAFVLFGRVGIPAPNEAVVLPLAIGTFCFNPSVLDPSNPALFILADNLTNGPALLPSTPAPWLQTVTGIPVPIQVTLQPIILEDGITLRTGNAIILNVQ